MSDISVQLSKRDATETALIFKANHFEMVKKRKGSGISSLVQLVHQSRAIEFSNRWTGEATLSIAKGLPCFLFQINLKKRLDQCG